MKKILTALLTVSASAFAFAQPKVIDTTKTAASLNRSSKTSIAKPPPEKPKPVVIPTPEFINQPYYYDRDDNRLVRLENATAQLATKKKSLGLKGAKKSLSVDGASSKIRFVSKNNITFLIKTSGDVIDLTSYVKLYKLSVTDEKREVVISSKEGILNDKDEDKSSSISISVKQVSKDNYMIAFSEPLPAGEYGFVWVKNLDLQEFGIYAFGIDWRRSD